MPVLNVFAEDDHIIPPQELAGAGGRSSAPRTTPSSPLPGGHVGVFVSGKSQGILGKGIVDWLRQRD